MKIKIIMCFNNLLILPWAICLSLARSCSLLFSCIFLPLPNSCFSLTHDFLVPETKEVVIHKYKTPMVR